MRYNFVFFNVKLDYWKYSISALNGLHNVKIIKNSIDNDNGILVGIYDLLDYIYKKTNVPTTRLFNKYRFNNTFLDNKPICFVIFGSGLDCVRSRYIDFLREHYDKCKIVLFYGDLVSKDSNKKEMLDKYRNQVDYIISYDPGDAKTYKFGYYEAFYSFDKELAHSGLKNDVFFIGKAKNRIDRIHAAFRYFSENGFACKFYVIDVPKDKQIDDNMIVYNKYLSYEEVVKEVKQSRSILDIVQDSSKGMTIRAKEAIAYDKILITDNEYMNNNPLFPENALFVFNSIEDIDLDLFNKTEKPIYPDKSKDVLNPQHFLEYIDKRLAVMGE